MSPWLGLMAMVVKAQVTWGPQPMFLSVPWQSAYRVNIFPFRAWLHPFLLLVCSFISGAEETDDVTNQQRLYELLRQAYFTET